MSKKTNKEKIVTPEAEKDIICEESEVICPPEPEIGVVANCKALNIRKGPSIDAEIVTVLDEARIVKILDTENDFYKVEIATDQIGYCMQKFIEVEE